MLVAAVAALVWLAAGRALQGQAPRRLPAPVPPAHPPVHTLQFRQPKQPPELRLAARWVTELPQHRGCPCCTIACLSTAFSFLLT
ncbi:hypothetical protein D3Y59_09835 [Hymenobacter oligotrophus]|uniref:Uncharacterized protein n=1 Tax=Hymenobacter oligotrophus TaxID=2319843 RepID=A0A3B7RDM6_9BACT|nr:hypothetical protein D3Y59_09835 [Hymenobacter oligotrophus]